MHFGNLATRGITRGLGLQVTASSLLPQTTARIGKNTESSFDEFQDVPTLSGISLFPEHTITLDRRMVNGEWDKDGKCVPTFCQKDCTEFSASKCPPRPGPAKPKYEEVPFPKGLGPSSHDRPVALPVPPAAPAKPPSPLPSPSPAAAPVATPAPASPGADANSSEVVPGHPDSSPAGDSNDGPKGEDPGNSPATAPQNSPIDSGEGPGAGVSGGEGTIAAVGGDTTFVSVNLADPPPPPELHIPSEGNLMLAYDHTIFTDAVVKIQDAGKLTNKIANDFVLNPRFDTTVFRLAFAKADMHCDPKSLTKALLTSLATAPYTGETLPPALKELAAQVGTEEFLKLIKVKPRNIPSLLKTGKQVVQAQPNFATWNADRIRLGTNVGASLAAAAGEKAVKAIGDSSKLGASWISRGVKAADEAVKNKFNTASFVTGTIGTFASIFGTAWGIRSSTNNANKVLIVHTDTTSITLASQTLETIKTWTDNAPSPTSTLSNFVVDGHTLEVLAQLTKIAPTSLMAATSGSTTQVDIASANILALPSAQGTPASLSIESTTLNDDNTLASSTTYSSELPVVTPSSRNASSTISSAPSEDPGGLRLLPVPGAPVAWNSSWENKPTTTWSNSVETTGTPPSLDEVLSDPMRNITVAELVAHGDQNVSSTFATVPTAPSLVAGSSNSSDRYRPSMLPTGMHRLHARDTMVLMGQAQSRANLPWSLLIAIVIGHLVLYVAKLG